MRRLVALFLCLFLMLTFTACGKDKKDNKNETHTVDVEYYAKIGQIPEHKYHLGSDAVEMKNAFDAEDEKMPMNQRTDTNIPYIALLSMMNIRFYPMEMLITIIRMTEKFRQ